MITAWLVQDWMYRGSSYTLVVNVVRNAQGDPYEISETAVAKLRISLSSTYPNALIEKEASRYVRNLGNLHFEFEPADTERLLAVAHDLTIHLEDGDKVLPVFKGRFGIVDINEGVAQ